MLIPLFLHSPYSTNLTGGAVYRSGTDGYFYRLYDTPATMRMDSKKTGVAPTQYVLYRKVLYGPEYKGSASYYGKNQYIFITLVKHGDWFTKIKPRFNLY